MIQKYTANGKLMLFGEYLVLKGEPCLAIPLKFGQSLEILPYSEEGLLWQSFQFDECWLEIHFSKELEIISTTDIPKAEKIQELLKYIISRNPNLQFNKRYFKFAINFDRNYGFGTSSTLVSLLSDWSGIDAYELLEHSFGGSGYDVAGAKAESAYFYTLENRFESYWNFPKEISGNLLFVYLGQKQKSDKSVASFNTKEVNQKHIYFMNFIMQSVFECKTIEDWEELIIKSEDFLSKLLELPKVKDNYFSDYPYHVKSLGAWGGDFVMTTFRDKTKAVNYFKNKGFEVIYDFNEIHR